MNKGHQKLKRITLCVESTIDFIVRHDNHSPCAFKGFYCLDYRLNAVYMLCVIISFFFFSGLY